MVEIGDAAPLFVGRTTDGKQLSLADLRGRAVVLYFFPRAFTPG